MSLEEKAKKLIQVSGAVQNIEYALNEMLKALNSNGITAEEAEIIAEAGIPVYVNNLTEQEMDDAIAWHTSESGKAMVSKNLTIMNDMQEITKDLVQKMVYDRIHKGLTTILVGD